MIWAWIAAAVAISWLFCKKGISWYHYIWLLLPIEMYGVTIAGATLKPYMLFGICIIASDLVRDKTIRVPVAIIAAVFALIISDFSDRVCDGICNAAYNVHSGFDDWFLLSASSKRWH